MKLSTRIASFEWLLVGLLIGVSALSVRLIAGESQRAADQLRMTRQATQSLAAMKLILWGHEVAEQRVRLGEGRAQALAEHREDFGRAMTAALEAWPNPKDRGLLADLGAKAQQYLRGDASLETALKGFQPLDDAGEAALKVAIERELSGGRTGVTLIASIGAVALLSAILLAARASRRVTQPLDVLLRTSLSLAEGRSNRRVPDGEYDETIRELARAINILADRLESAERGADLEQALLEAGADALIERSPRPTLILDLSGHTRLANAAGRRLLERASLDELGVSVALDRAMDEGEAAPPPQETGVEATRLIARRGTAIGFLVRLPPGGSIEA